ncbi:MAG: hypothetical protein ACRDVP_05580 [Acidimicrobiales bacterium]
MSGLMGGSWRRGSPAGHLRVPGRCAEKRHRNGLVGTQLAGHLLPRQLPTRLRQGNSSAKFGAIDSYVHERLARLASRKHGLHGTNWLDRFTWSWSASLGVYRLTGTVRYPAVNAYR